jgi:hypothetical protein
MLEKIINLTTGTYTHWYKTNNVAFKNLHEGIMQLDNSQSEIFNKFLVASNIVIEKLIGPEKELFPLSKITRANVKSLTISDFDSYYKELVRLFGQLHSLRNNTETTQIQIGYELLFDDAIYITDKPIDIEVIKKTIYNGIDQLILKVPFMPRIDPVRTFTLYNIIIACSKTI